MTTTKVVVDSMANSVVEGQATAKAGGMAIIEIEVPGTEASMDKKKG